MKIEIFVDRNKSFYLQYFTITLSENLYLELTLSHIACRSQEVFVFLSVNTWTVFRFFVVIALWKNNTTL